MSPRSATVCDDCESATVPHDFGVGAVRNSGKDGDAGGVGGDGGGDGAVSATHCSGDFDDGG